MEIIETYIQNLKIIKPTPIYDNRGYFMESFKINFMERHFPDIRFVQENESKSSYGVLRGLHFQKPPFAQTKLVRVIEGEVLDVAVDLREGSLSYGKYKSVILSDKNHLQLFIPKGFAHGFLVLSKTAIFQYKVDNPYNQESEEGIRYDDKELNIDWILPDSDLIISKKDYKNKSFEEYRKSEEKFLFI